MRHLILALAILASFGAIGAIGVYSLVAWPMPTTRTTAGTPEAHMRRIVLAVAIALFCGLSAAGAIAVYSVVAPAYAAGWRG